jgi:hypothetical protein
MILKLLGTILGFYLGLGVVFWIAQTAADVVRDPLCERPGEIPEVHQLLGFDNSGLTRILAWGPSLGYALMKHDYSLSEFALPTRCAPKGAIALDSTRCACRAPSRLDPKWQRLVSFCSATHRYWAPPGKTCQADRPDICCKD